MSVLGCSVEGCDGRVTFEFLVTAPVNDGEGGEGVWLAPMGAEYRCSRGHRLVGEICDEWEEAAHSRWVWLQGRLFDPAGSDA